MQTRRTARYPYALIVSEKKIHRLPSTERCNLDAATKAGHRRLRTSGFEAQIPRFLTEGWALCEYCFPDGKLDA